MTTSWPHADACGHRKRLPCPARLFILEEGRGVWEGSGTSVPAPLSPRQLHSGDLLRGPRLGGGGRGELGVPELKHRGPVLRKLPLSPAKPSCPSPTGPLRPALLGAGSEVINWQGLWRGERPGPVRSRQEGFVLPALLDLQVSNKELS